jgi:hypothetical protein
LSPGLEFIGPLSASCYVSAAYSGAARWLCITKAEVLMFILVNSLFWDKKLKIAVLTLATFAALC